MNKSSHPNPPKRHSLFHQPSLESIDSLENQPIKSASPSRRQGGVAFGLIAGLMVLQLVTLVAAISTVRPNDWLPLIQPNNNTEHQQQFNNEKPVVIILPSPTPALQNSLAIADNRFPTPTLIPPTSTPSPTPTTLPPPLRIRGVELTQGIQVLQEPENPRCHPDPAHSHNVLCNNSIPMVAGRHTMVRVYLACPDGCSVNDGVVRLRLLKDGQEQTSLAHSFAVDDLQRIDTLSLAQLRGDLENSVNFTFLPPPEWMTGQITFDLEARFDTQADSKELLPPDRYSLTKEFIERKPLRVAYLPIEYNGLRPADPAEADYWLQRLYPVPSVEYYRLPMPDMTWEGDLSKGEVLRKLLYTYWLYGQYRSNEAHPDQLFGWLPQEVYNGGAADPYWCPNCAGPHSSRVAFGGVRPEQDIGAPRILAHEIAHNLGAQHAWSPTAQEDGGCFKEEGANIQVDPDWPYSFTPNIQEFGIDLYSNPPIIYPPSTYDVMSYCVQPWISPHTYRKIFDSPFLKPGDTAPPVPTEYLTQVETTNQGTLMVSGVVYRDGTVSQPEVIRLEGDALNNSAGFMPPQPAGDDYCLEVWDQNDQRLAQRCFDAGFADLEQSDLTDTSAFLFLLPEVDPAVVSKITVSHGQEALVEVAPSNHAPQIKLNHLPGETLLQGRKTISWQAEDVDGDRLSYDIFYSSDQGTSWLPLAVQLSSMEYTFYTSQIPTSSPVRLRVTVTDGFHTTTAEFSATFGG